MAARSRRLPIATSISTRRSRPTLAGNIYFGYMVVRHPVVIAWRGDDCGTRHRRYRHGSRRAASATFHLGGGGNRRLVDDARPFRTSPGDHSRRQLGLHRRELPAPMAHGYLFKLNSATLWPQGQGRRPGSAMTGGNAIFHDSGTALPMIGPDGDVYMGVFDTAARAAAGSSTIRRISRRPKRPAASAGTTRRRSFQPRWSPRITARRRICSCRSTTITSSITGPART